MRLSRVSLQLKDGVRGCDWRHEAVVDIYEQIFALNKRLEIDHLSNS
jgi:hypothetical protein